jgi:hypothetical protein
MLSTCHAFHIVVKLGFSRQTFEKSSNFRYYEKPSSGSGVVSCGQTDRQMDGRTEGQSEKQTELTTLKIVFRNLANRPENHFESMRLCKWCK